MASSQAVHSFGLTVFRVTHGRMLKADAFSKTWSLQVRAQLQGWPDNLHGYIYPFVTIASGVVLGIVLYGWSVWSTL